MRSPGRWSVWSASAVAPPTPRPTPEALGQVRPDVPKLLIWDNAPPHHPKLVQQAAQAAHIQIAFLPFRAPELMPCEDLWRQRKARWWQPIGSMPISSNSSSGPSPGWMPSRPRTASAARALRPPSSPGYRLGFGPLSSRERYSEESDCKGTRSGSVRANSLSTGKSVKACSKAGLAFSSCVCVA
jgi:DDE superfamily endonuclease